MTTLGLMMSGLLSWLIRVSMITLIPAGRLPARVRNILDASAPAVMAAMVATSLTQTGGLTALITPSPMLGAAVIAGIAAWLTKRLDVTMLMGTGSVWLLQLVD